MGVPALHIFLQVNSNRTTLFEDFENKRISGYNSVSANWNGNKWPPFMSTWRIQSEVKWRIPLERFLVLENFVPDFTNFMALHFLGVLFERSFKKDFKTSTRCCSTLSWLKVNLPCCMDILQAPKICGIVQMSLWHKKIT